MKTTKTLAYGSTLVLLLLTVITFTPSASAAGPGEGELKVRFVEVTKAFDSEVRGGRIAPESSALILTFKWKVTVPAATICPIQLVTLKFDPPVEDHAWKEESSAKLSSDQISFGTDPAKSDKATEYPLASGDTFNAVLTVRVTRNAPAFGEGSFTIRATAQGSSATAGCNAATSATPASGGTTVTVDYLPVMQYTPAKYLQKVGQNKELSYVVTMSNLGNGETKVTTKVTQPEGLDSVGPPADITLDSRAQKGKDAEYEKDGPITVKTPSSNGYTNSIYTFVATFEAKSTNSIAPDQVIDSQSITFTVQVQGVYVPGFDPSMTIGALGVGLLVLGFARRRLG